MNQEKVIRTTITMGILFGVPLGLFQFTLFTVVFLMVGGAIATIISIIIPGSAVPFFLLLVLVLIAEYLLLVAFMAIGMLLVNRQHKQQDIPQKS